MQGVVIPASVSLSNMPTLRLTLQKRLAWQDQVAREASRFNVVNVGRRAGKTVLGLDRCATRETLSYPVAWFSPTYKMLLEVWREAVRTFAPITVRRTVQERRLEFLTGGLLEFWSLDNPDVARGRKYRRIVVDEAAMVPNLMDIWQYALRPTLADYVGDAWFLSTPKGRNGFWRMFQWGIDPAMPDWMAWQMPSTVGMVSPSEIDEMQRTLPDRAFRQEILAEFLEDGTFFQNVTACATATAQTVGTVGRQYAIGVDWARSAGGDYTVYAVMDVREQALVHLTRFAGVDYNTQRSRLRTLHLAFNRAPILAEYNSMGGPQVEALQADGLPVRGFTTTAGSKHELISALELAFDQQQISILDDPTLIAELQAYEKRERSGYPAYGAPEGMHDDTVIALALAWEAAHPPQGAPIPPSYSQRSFA